MEIKNQVQSLTMAPFPGLQLPHLNCEILRPDIPLIHSNTKHCINLFKAETRALTSAL